MRKEQVIDLSLLVKKPERKQSPNGIQLRLESRQPSPSPKEKDILSKLAQAGKRREELLQKKFSSPLPKLLEKMTVVSPSKTSDRVKLVSAFVKQQDQENRNELANRIDKKMSEAAVRRQLFQQSLVEKTKTSQQKRQQALKNIKQMTEKKKLEFQQRDRNVELRRQQFQEQHHQKIKQEKQKRTQVLQRKHKDEICAA